MATGMEALVEDDDVGGHLEVISTYGYGMKALEEEDAGG